MLKNVVEFSNVDFKKKKKNTCKRYQKFHNFFEFPDPLLVKLQFIVYRITLRRTKNKYFISRRYARMKSFIISLNFLNVIRASYCYADYDIFIQYSSAIVLKKERKCHCQTEQKFDLDRKTAIDNNIISETN